MVDFHCVWVDFGAYFKNFKGDVMRWCDLKKRFTTEFQEMPRQEQIDSVHLFCDKHNFDQDRYYSLYDDEDCEDYRDTIKILIKRVQLVGLLKAKCILLSEHVINVVEQCVYTDDESVTFAPDHILLYVNVSPWNGHSGTHEIDYSEIENAVLYVYVYSKMYEYYLENFCERKRRDKIEASKRKISRLESDLNNEKRILNELNGGE